MKKYICFLSLLLMMLCILPLAGGAESPAGAATDLDRSEAAAESSPFAGINTRFSAPSRIAPTDPQTEEKESLQVVQVNGVDAVIKQSMRAQDIELIDANVHTFGGSGNDRLIDAVMMRDGGFLLVGYTDIETESQSGMQQSAWALRFSKDGEKLWEYTHYNKESTGYFDMAKETADGRILLHYGNTLFNLRTHSLLILSADGELMDESQMSSLVYKVYRSQDGIIVDTGTSLTKYSDDLVVQYELEDVALSHMEFSTEDGRLFFGYLLREDSYLGDAIVFMLNETGDILWDVIVQENARFEGCIELSDGDYLCTGFMENSAGRESGLAMRIGPDGEVRYVQEFSRTGEHFFISHAYELDEGALLVGGSNKQSQVFLITIDGDGNELQRVAMNIGRRVELTSTPLRVLETEEQLFIVGDLIFYRNLLTPEDADFFILPLDPQ